MDEKQRGKEPDGIYWMTRALAAQTRGSWDPPDGSVFDIHRIHAEMMMKPLRDILENMTA